MIFTMLIIIIITIFIIIETEHCFSVSWKYQSFQYYVYFLEPVLARSSYERAISYNKIYISLISDPYRN